MGGFTGICRMLQALSLFSHAFENAESYAGEENNKGQEVSLHQSPS